MSRSPEIDRYIAAAQPFAQPILKKLRMIFHRADPRLQETIKWGAPTFEHKGIVGGMAAFKKHVAWGLWKAPLIRDDADVLLGNRNSPRCGGNIFDVKELPAAESIIPLIRQAVELNEQGMKMPRMKSSRPKKIFEMPPQFQAALNANKAAKSNFDKMPPSHRKEYIEWIAEAKQAATRERRLAQAMEWIGEGKPRNWKYMTRVKAKST